MGDVGYDASAGTAPWWRDVALSFAGVVTAPLLLTLMSRMTPDSIPLWLTDLIMLTFVAAVFFVLRWRTFAAGMLVSSVVWIGFTLWLTAEVSPDW